MWLLWLASCNGLDHTGPDGLVARVYSPEGVPVAGLEVRSIEASGRTDAEGRVAVHYQVPHSAELLWGDVRVRYLYQPDHEGTVRDLHLPALVERTIACTQRLPCTLALEWPLGDGLAATVVRTCEPGGTVVLRAPIGQPEGTCRGTEAVYREGAVVDPPVVVRVDVRTEPGGAPQACTVFAGTTRAHTAEEGSHQASISGPTPVWARCDGRPTLPVIAQGQPGEVVLLDWTPMGPRLDLSVAAPGFDGPLTLATEQWSLPLVLDETGAYLLPPLPAGSYRVYSDPSVEVPPAGAPGTFVLSRRAGDTEQASGGIGGSLVLDADWIEGEVRIQGP